MELNFINAGINRNKCRASIHATGKLSFNKDASELLKLSNGKYFKVATNQNEKNSIYLVESDKNSTAAKVYKSGNLFYILFVTVLDNLKIDYKKYNHIYRVDKYEEKYEGKEVYILKRIDSKIRTTSSEKNIHTKEQVE